MVQLPRDVRRDLLHVLTSPSNVRADVIRQFYERGDDGFVEVFVELETDAVLRWLVVQVLESAESDAI